MNLARFGLRRPPFPASPDVRSYVPLATHEAAATAVRRAHAGGAGLALVDGGSGSGKSFVALRVVSDLADSHSCLVVPAARFARPGDLFQAILFDLGAEYRGLSETELRLAVTDRLLAGLAAGKPTVVVLDEAQHLSDDAIEEVRLLGNLAGPGAPAVFVLLVAQPVLRARLGGAGLAAVADRLGARSRLEPLDGEDSVRLVRGQLEAAGGEADELIDDEAAGLLAEHARGSPRLLGQAAALAFALADEAEADAVDAEAALEAVTRLGLYDPATSHELGPGVLPLPAKPAVRRTRKRKSA